MKLTISKEDYLKAIAEAESEEEPVIAATIARWLKITPPAVALALRRLQRDKLIRVGGSGRISLTPAGRQISDRLRKRHYLIERMLTEMLGMEWYKVHDEAERLEHAVSDDFERKLIQKLGEQGPCPRGDGINTGAAERRKSGLILLAEVPAGTRVQVVGMYERDRSLLEYFDGLGLRPGSQLQVVSRNYDHTMTLNLGVKQVHLGQAAAGKVWVQGDNPRPGSKAV
ncbi:MAG: metal-dependent transcriptional regulator [Terriglobia bacterium]|jgi:DtxR family Mn-dependent transcriptional regulator